MKRVKTEIHSELKKSAGKPRLLLNPEVNRPDSLEEGEIPAAEPAHLATSLTLPKVKECHHQDEEESHSDD